MLRSKKKHQFLKKYCSDVKIDKNPQKKQIPLPKLKDGKTRESEFGNSAYVKRHVLNLSMLWTCVRLYTLCTGTYGSILLIHTAPLTISYHLLRFLISKYSVVEIRYFIKKRNENDKNKFLK